jgi:hypothetical protein
MVACVVVPLHRVQPQASEVLSLKQLAVKLGNHHIEFAAPAGLDVAPYRAILGDRKDNRFHPKFFATVRGYNQLVVRPEFYRPFAESYEHILIHQADAFVFEDQLARWAAKDFDNIGAPHWAGWGAEKEKGMVGVGNGGLCLRRVEACIRALERSRWRRSLRRARRGRLWEDIYWSYHAPIRVAPVDEAVKFAFEVGLEHLWETYQAITPFGCHGVWNLDYIANYRRGTPENREPEYERVLYSILERSGSGL